MGSQRPHFATRKRRGRARLLDEALVNRLGRSIQPASSLNLKGKLALAKRPVDIWTNRRKETGDIKQK